MGTGNVGESEWVHFAPAECRNLRTAQSECAGVSESDRVIVVSVSFSCLESVCEGAFVRVWVLGMWALSTRVWALAMSSDDEMSKSDKRPERLPESVREHVK